MKKIYTFIVALLLLPAVLSAQEQTLTLTTSRAVGETLTFTVNRTPGGINVDWGDGNAVSYSNTSDVLLEVSGTLAGQTVTITGDQFLNTIICEGQGLTAVNLTNAPNLKSVYLSHNELSALAVRALGKNLLDLDCSHNALKVLSLSVSNHPNVETLNISNNELGSLSGTSTSTNYVGTFANLQYLDISDNGRIKQAVVSSNNELDYLNCSGNVLTRLTLPSEGRLTTIDAAGNSLTALDVTPFSGLQQIDITGNSITTLDLSNTKVVSEIFAADNELTSLPFTTRAARDTIYICDIRGNRLHFNGLPRTTSKMKYLNVYPQRPFALTTDMGFKQGSVVVDGETYSALYVTQNPSYASRTNTDYIVDLTPLRTDGNGSARNVLTFISVNGNDSTELVQYLVSAGDGDYTVTGNKFTFLKEYRTIVIKLTNTTGYYKDYTFVSEPFTINEPTATAIGNITLDTNEMDNAPIYDLQGRRVTNPQRGVYIIGGKKVFIR